ncbi:MAG TPA: hypothetical protein VNB94_06475 [Mycobacteriales bacterium]|nr:hypothetical protein [Mycobacteriales bacterium]
MSRVLLVAAYAVLQVVGYLVLSVPGAPSYGDLEPGVWVVMDFFIFVTLALAAGLRFADWVARLSAAGLTGGLTALAARDGFSREYVVLIAGTALMTVAASLVRPRAPAERAGAGGRVAAAR